MRYANHIVLIVLLLIGFIAKDYIHISSNLASLFITDKNAQKMNIASELGYTKEMYIAVKGFDNKAKQEVDSLSQELSKIEGIKSVVSSIEPTQEIREYYKNHYPLLAHFNTQKLTSKEISTKLQALYNAQLSNTFYTPINQNDPLELFVLDNTTTKGVSHRGKYMALDSYGLLLRIETNVAPSQMSKSKVLYDECQKVLAKHKDTISFAPFFYTVENSSYIKKDIQIIIVLSILILLLVYYFLLRNLALLFETLIALASSMLFATLVSTYFFDNFHILSLAFGMSITAVSIDYLLHYYFHGFYENKKHFDTNVLYGFLTTISAFTILSFIPIPLLSQISFFAVISLSFAFVLFTFIFKFIHIKPFSKQLTSQNNLSKIPSQVIFLVSVLLLIYSSLYIKLDTNIRNLDYQNTLLQEKETMFKQANTQNLKPVIVHAKTLNNLIQNLRTLEKEQRGGFSLASFILDKQQCQKKKEQLQAYDFTRLNEKINILALEEGFREGYFNNAYTFVDNLPSCELRNIELFRHYNLGVHQDKDMFFTMAFVPDIKAIEYFPFVSNINLKELFSKVAQEMYINLIFYAFLVISLVLILLLLSVKKRFLYALNYILFPLSLTLAILVSFIQINLMHFFALILLIAIGIDYGIYMSNTKKQSNTILAIRYSLLSTFAGFGVLIFSSIVALNSIGLVISLGVMSIFFLIKLMK